MRLFAPALSRARLEQLLSLNAKHQPSSSEVSLNIPEHEQQSQDAAKSRETEAR